MITYVRLLPLVVGALLVSLALVLLTIAGVAVVRWALIGRGYEYSALIGGYNAYSPLIGQAAGVLPQRPVPGLAAGAGAEAGPQPRHHPQDWLRYSTVQYSTVQYSTSFPGLTQVTQRKYYLRMYACLCLIRTTVLSLLCLFDVFFSIHNTGSQFHNSSHILHQFNKSEGHAFWATNKRKQLS